LAVGIWIWTQFDVSTSAAGVFTHYANPYYLNDFLPVIINNLVRFFTESTPVFFLLQFLLAGYYFIHRLRRRANITVGEITTFVFAALVGVAYLRTIGWYRYFFPGQVILYLFVVPGLLALAKDITTIKDYGRYLAPVGVLILLAAQLLPLSKTPYYVLLTQQPPLNLTLEL
jgi:FtsH-binding integral membrane protein